MYRLAAQTFEERLAALHVHLQYTIRLSLDDFVRQDLQSGAAYPRTYVHNSNGFELGLSSPSGRQ
jgi:hypothetical protein